MEDSIKGILVTITIISIFMTCIINFIVIFPQEQGATFTDKDNQTYLVMSNVDLSTEGYLGDVNNQSGVGFDQWDIEVGFMGSNTQKGSKEGINAYTSNIFINLGIISTQIFGANSPIVWVIGVLGTLAISYIIYLFIKFVRTGS